MKNLASSPSALRLRFSRRSAPRQLLAATLCIVFGAGQQAAKAADYFWKGGDGDWDLGIYSGDLIPGPEGQTNPAGGATFDPEGEWIAGTSNWRNSLGEPVYWVNSATQQTAITETQGATGPWVPDPASELRGRAIFDVEGGGRVNVADVTSIRTSGIFGGAISFRADGYELYSDTMARMEMNFGTGIGVSSGMSATIGTGINLWLTGGDNISGGGTLNVTGSISRSSAGIIRIIEGTTINVEAGGSFGVTSNQIYVGTNNTGGTLHVNGGFVTVGGNGQNRALRIAPGNANTNPSGTVTLNSGAITITNAGNGGLILGDSVPASSQASFALNGGTLTTPFIHGASGGAVDTTFLFNGGFVRATAGNIPVGRSFMDGITRTLVQQDGALIDTNSRTISIGQTLEHDPEMGGDPDGGLFVTGGGILALEAENTYTGPTLVMDATLLVNGLLSDSSDVEVAGWATIGGIGQIQSPLTISSGGIIAPGPSEGIGNLTVASVTFSEDTSLEIDIDGANADLLTSSGNVDLSNVGLNIVEHAGGFTQNSYVIVQAGSLSGTFSDVPAGYTVSYTGTQAVLSKDGGPDSGYLTWALANGLTEGVNDGENEDPDHDGIPNILEYVLGGLPIGPETADTSILPVQSVMATDVRVEFNRSAASLADTTVILQTSTDLQNWADHSTIDESGAISIDVPRSMEADGKLFVRLRAER